ncbi:MAG: 30S ribosome-binding factor RbfA [Sedimenticola sp.]
MAREFNRTDRVGSQMQRELAELVRTELDGRKLGMVTIQTVQVVRDFSHAKVFFTTMGGELSEAEATRALKDAAPTLRYRLGSRMRLRTIPQLHFVYDDSIEQGRRLSALIEQAVESDESNKTEE